MVMAAVIAVLAASCQKENAIVDTPTASTYPAGTVNYIVGKVSNSRTVESAEQWNALVDECFDGADEGHLVTIAHGVTTNPSKERLTYTTESRETAMAWVKAKYEEGYDVTLWYDEEQGRYICVASKTATADGFVAPNGFVYQPLQQYLIGNWTKCLDRKVGLADRAGYVNLDLQTGMLSMSWHQIYDFFEIVPANIADTVWSQIRITSDTISGYTWGIYGLDEYQPYELHQNIVCPGVGLGSMWYLRWIAFEWSQDTMFVIFERKHQIYPEIFIRN